MHSKSKKFPLHLLRMIKMQEWLLTCISCICNYANTHANETQPLGSCHAANASLCGANFGYAPCFNIRSHTQGSAFWASPSQLSMAWGSLWLHQVLKALHIIPKSQNFSWAGQEGTELCIRRGICEVNLCYVKKSREQCPTLLTLTSFRLVNAVAPSEAGAYAHLSV